MKALIAITALLFSQTLADDSISIINQGNDGGSIHQTVNINNENNIANINAHAGMCSSNSIFDYGRGLIATRLLSRRACYVGRMNREIFPSLKELRQLAYDQQMGKSVQFSRQVRLQYAPAQPSLTSIDQFGPHVEAMCRDIPTYPVRLEENELFVEGGGCAKAGILGIFGISICGGITFF
ncbi:gastrokine-2 [Microcaecilia unicolor]|uniref:Gastrokine-2 n=1 Tax=Microcaecilia unicolor TaxID=1415580 RepID=A0A6P7Y4N7_9AMPH|nr:gastrokine-2 [Microcaecilia unicolor]